MVKNVGNVFKYGKNAEMRSKCAPAFIYTGLFFAVVVSLPVV